MASKTILKWQEHSFEISRGNTQDFFNHHVAEVLLSSYARNQNFSALEIPSGEGYFI